MLFLIILLILFSFLYPVERKKFIKASQGMKVFSFHDMSKYGL